MDKLRHFIGECCILWPDLKTQAKRLYADYRMWAEESGLRPVAQARFGTSMADRGYQKNQGTAWHRVCTCQMDV
jgi:phage/plasmid-associated DNA primase